MDNLYPYTVLYVEDEEKIRTPYTRLLRSVFDRVLPTSNGLEALQIYNRELPDLVVADIVLPKMDGLELLAKIRKNDLRTRAILLTAFTTRDLLLKATELDISNYLVKPVKKQELLEALDKAVRQLELMDGRFRTSLSTDKVEKLGQRLGLEHPQKDLTKNETMFLHILASDTERFFTTEEIERAFYYEFNKEISVNAIKALIKRLRKKLLNATIENQFGYGYRLVLTK